MHILLAVSGSISAYKSYDICRELVKAGHEVKVILTKGGQKFVLPKTFSYLGAKEVFINNADFADEYSKSILHIDLARWCERLIIAPCSANTIAKLANAFAEDLLSTVFLALDRKPCIVFPAMNPTMFSHQLVQENIKKLSSCSHVYFVPPAMGEMACGETGEGKLEEVQTICDLSTTIPTMKLEQKVLITTGATISALDPVRYLTNPSSGLTGYYLAKKFLKQGHQVCVIAGQNSTDKLNQLIKHPNFKLIRVVETQDMREAVMNHIKSADFYISSAALSDIAFKKRTEKLKKDQLNGSLEVLPAPDVLAEVLSQRRKDQFIVGFAAETDDKESTYLTKWHRKPVDLLIGNVVDNGLSTQAKKKGFTTEDGEYAFVEKGQIVYQSMLSKDQLAEEIYQRGNKWLNSSENLKN